MSSCVTVPSGAEDCNCPQLAGTAASTTGTSATSGFGTGGLGSIGSTGTSAIGGIGGSTGGIAPDMCQPCTTPGAACSDGLTTCINGVCNFTGCTANDLCIFLNGSSCNTATDACTCP